ncbi:MAG: chemotaxis protein CheW [Pseudomonadota bacterium]
MSLEPMDPVEKSPESITDQYLTFLLDGVEYGIDILKVKEIKSWSAVTPIPSTTTTVLGVINLRGSIVPVIDARMRFYVDGRDQDDTTAVIIVNSHNHGVDRFVGLLVDEVADVHNLRAVDIQNGDDVVGSVSADLISGLGKAEDKMVIIIELEKVVATCLWEDDTQNGVAA